MRIEQLKPSQHVTGRWLAVMDDGSILRVGEGEVVDFALYTGRELTQEEAEQLTQAVRRTTLREKTVDLLTRKPMSRRELERRLEEWDATGEEAAALCDRMEELGFLNDGQYALLVVRHYSAKGYGERKLRDELYRRGVPRELWEEALMQTSDPGQAIDAFLSSRLKGSHDPKELKKASDALARRGFHWSQISDGLRRYGADVED